MVISSRIFVAAAALIWNQVAFLHDDRDVDFTAEPGLVEMRRKLADYLNSMADSVDRREAFSLYDAAGLVNPSLLESEHYGEYARNTIARYGDLQNMRQRLAGRRSPMGIFSPAPTGMSCHGGLSF